MSSGEISAFLESYRDAFDRLDGDAVADLWHRCCCTAYEEDRRAMKRASELPAIIGETFSLRVRLSDNEIPAFARSVHDHNPLHYDLAVARAAGYRALIACGPHLGGIFMGMTATHFAKPMADGRTRSGVGLAFEVRFRAPVYANEDIDLHWGVTGLEWKESLTGWITRLEGDARAGDKILLSGIGTLLLRMT